MSLFPQRKSRPFGQPFHLDLVLISRVLSLTPVSDQVAIIYLVPALLSGSSGTCHILPTEGGAKLSILWRGGGCFLHRAQHT